MEAISVTCAGEADRYDYVVESGKQKERLDRYLTRSIQGATRSLIKKLIDSQKVTVDGKIVKAGYLLNPGEHVTVDVPKPRLPVARPENIPIEFLYQDRFIAVVNKAPGMIVHPSPHTWTGTLVNGLLYHIRDLSGINGELRPGIVHRLDKGTTGVIVISKDDRTHRYLSYLFSARKITKIYHAIVWGQPHPRNGVIEKPLKRSKKDIRKMAVDPDGKASVTEYRTLQVYPLLSYLKVQPRTGRTHQIRSHLASVGLPVFGDMLYGGRNRQCGSPTQRNRALLIDLLSRIDRQALHAYTLGFPHPKTKEYMEFTAPLPEDMLSILDRLEQVTEAAEFDLHGLIKRS